MTALGLAAHTAADHDVARRVIRGLAVIPVSLFALYAHRCVLLPVGPDPSSADRHEPRTTHFVGWALLAFATFATLPRPVREMADPGSAERILGFTIAHGVGMLTLYYCVTRSSLVFPISAIGDAGGPPRSWSLTKGNGWRLLYASTLPYLLVATPLLLLATLQGLEAETLRARSGEIVTIVPRQAVVLLVAALEAAVLSLAYRELAPVD